MRSRFTPDRLAWLDQVADDPSITAAGFRVAFAISRWFNRDRHTTTGELHAWPSQDEIAARARLTRRGAQKAIDTLAGQGHLSVIAGRGRGLRSTYEALVHERAEVAADVPENANDGSPISDGKRRTGRHEKANDETRKGERLFAHNSDEKSDDQIYPPAPKGDRSDACELSDDEIASRFVLAWGFDDPTDRKEPALRLLAQEPHADQMAAIRAAPRYRGECRARNRKPCHAKTWIRERGWTEFEVDAAPPPDIPRIFIEQGTPQGKAYAEAHFRATGKKIFMTEMNAPGGRRAVGRYERTEWPPGWPVCNRDRMPPRSALREVFQ